MTLIVDSAIAYGNVCNVSVDNVEDWNAIYSRHRNRSV